MDEYSVNPNSSNNNVGPTPSSSAEPTGQLPPTPSVPPEKKKSKWLIVLVIVLVLAAMGAAYYLLVMKDSDNTPSSQSNNQTVSATTERFYFADSANKVTFYNPVSGEKQSTELTLDEDRYLPSTAAGMNQQLQIAADGQKIFYQSIKPIPGQPVGGEGEPERESVLLSLFENDTETKLLEINATNDRGISDWVVNSDGTTIYYLESPPNKASFVLHMLTVSDKKDTIIKDNFIEPGTNNNPMFVTPSGDLLIYTAQNYTLTEHKVSAGKYSTRQVGPFGCQCMLEYPQAISPDGSKLLLEEQTAEMPPSNFVYHIMDLASGKVEEFSKAEQNIQWVASLWSPDSKKIAHDTAQYGNPPNFKSLVEIVTVADKAKETIFSAEEGSVTPLTVVGWSKDGRFIAFLHQGVKFYDVVNNQLLANTLDDGITTYNVFGWE